MRRIVPIVMFILMEITLIGLGVWQLQRKAWKEELLTNIRRNQSAPLLNLIDTRKITPDMAFRRVALMCRYNEIASAFELGFDDKSQIAERTYHLCDFSNAPDLVARTTWSPKPHAKTVVGKETVFISDPSRPGATKPMSIHIIGRLYPWTSQTFYSSMIGDIGYDRKGFWQAARTGDIADYFVQSGDTLPPPPANNHFAYAIQWFIFAGVLAVIFTIWRRQQRLAPAAPDA